ncbi:Hypothetical protein UVM_LOCUS233 [uncultured virus]|nr:Hypothetical protein UVM_LOCUS233 [uncultured virus]
MNMPAASASFGGACILPSAPTWSGLPPNLFRSPTQAPSPPAWDPSGSSVTDTVVPLGQRSMAEWGRWLENGVVGRAGHRSPWPLAQLVLGQAHTPLTSSPTTASPLGARVAPAVLSLSESVPASSSSTLSPWVRNVAAASAAASRTACASTAAAALPMLLPRSLWTSPAAAEPALVSTAKPSSPTSSSAASRGVSSTAVPDMPANVRLLPSSSLPLSPPLLRVRASAPPAGQQHQTFSTPARPRRNRREPARSQEHYYNYFYDDGVSDGGDLVAHNERKRRRQNDDDSSDGNVSNSSSGDISGSSDGDQREDPLWRPQVKRDRSVSRRRRSRSSSQPRVGHRHLFGVGGAAAEYEQASTAAANAGDESLEDDTAAHILSRMRAQHTDVYWNAEVRCY